MPRPIPAKSIWRPPASAARPILYVTTANASNATLYDKLNFNFIHDIAPIVAIISFPYIMVVNPSVPAKTLPEFIA
jgi:tripartite-type tricarboxylate transporter receptor subunit TctC